MGIPRDHMITLVCKLIQVLQTHQTVEVIIKGLECLTSSILFSCPCLHA